MVDTVNKHNNGTLLTLSTKRGKHDVIFCFVLLTILYQILGKRLSRFSTSVLKSHMKCMLTAKL